MKYRHRLRLLLSRRGRRTLALNALAAFGLLGGAVQLPTAVWDFDEGLRHPWWVVIGVVAVSLLWGLYCAWPPTTVKRQFEHPDMVISVEVGDLFEQAGHLVVGFSDTFDTDTTDNHIVHANSVLGQMLQRVYGGDSQRLDMELIKALENTSAESVEPIGRKQGKLDRYPIGTVAVLGPPSRRIFGVAYTKMNNDLIARSTVDYIWHSLNQVWEAIHLHGQRERVAVPIIGAEFARITYLDRESLLKMILLSFVARSRQDPVCREMVLMVHPRDYEKINMLEVEAFLRSL